MRGMKGSSCDLAVTQHRQRIRRRTAVKDRVTQLSLDQAGREQAWPERKGSCRHAKAAFGFNTRQQGWDTSSCRTKNTCSGVQGLQETWCLHRGHPLSSTAPQPISPRGSPTPALHLSLSGLSSPHPGSQAVPRRPLLRAGEVLSQALYSYLYGAVINSQRLAAATRGGRFLPACHTSKAGTYLSETHSAAFSRGPFPVPQGLHGASGQRKRRAYLRECISKPRLFPHNTRWGKQRVPQPQGCPLGTETGL